jgi:hypothetical protein
MSEARNPPDSGLANATRQRIHFVGDAAGQVVLLDFIDPVPTRAIRTVLEPASLPGQRIADPSAALEVLSVTGHPNALNVTEELLAWVLASQPPTAPPPLTITLHGSHVIYGAGCVALLTAAERLDSLLLAVVDFHYHEQQLQKLERAVAASWGQLQADTPLAFAVTVRDLERLESVASQGQNLANVRMQLARLGPHLNRPGTHLSTLANQLGERLRERARVVERLETLAEQLEVSERVYEMASQRLNEFRLSRQEQVLEWTIIILLATQTLLLLLEYLRALER